AVLGGREEGCRDRAGARPADALEREALRDLHTRCRIDDAARDAAFHDDVAVAWRRRSGDGSGLEGCGGSGVAHEPSFLGSAEHGMRGRTAHVPAPGPVDALGEFGYLNPR